MTAIVSQRNGFGRRGFVKGALIGVSVAGMSAIGHGIANAEEGGYAQAAPVAYAENYLVDPSSEWELFATVEGALNIEGLNVLDGTIYAIDVLTHKIVRVEGGKGVTIWEDPEGVAMPNGARFIDDHTMLITDVAKGICTFDIGTAEYVSHVQEFGGVPFNGPNDLVLDGNGGAYFTDPGSSSSVDPYGRVYHVNYENGSYDVQLLAEGIAFPNGITISPSGEHVYVAEFNRNQILRIPSLTYAQAAPDSPWVFARLTGGHGPDGLMTDAAGNVFAAHYQASEIVVVDPNGFMVAIVRLPESAGASITNLMIFDGYLYACEADQSVIWRIPINDEMLAL